MNAGIVMSLYCKRLPGSINHGYSNVQAVLCGQVKGCSGDLRSHFTREDGLLNKGFLCVGHARKKCKDDQQCFLHGYSFSLSIPKELCLDALRSVRLLEGGAVGALQLQVREATIHMKYLTSYPRRPLA